MTYRSPTWRGWQHLVAAANSRVAGIVLFACTLSLTSTAAADATPPSTLSVPNASSPASGETAEPLPSDAERIASLQKSLKEDTEHLAILRADLQDRDQELEESSREYEGLSAELEKRKADVAKSGPRSPAELQQLRADIERLERKSRLAKERADLTVTERRNLQALITTLESKLRQDQQAIDKLKNGPGPEEAQAGEARVEQPKTTTATTAPAPLPGALPTAASVPHSAPATEAATKEEPPNRLVEAAHEATEQKAHAVKSIEQELASLGERKKTLQRDIELEHDMLLTARKRQDNLDLTVQTLEEEFAHKLTTGVPSTELQAAQREIRDVQRELREVRSETRQRTDRLQGLRTQLLELQSEELHVTRMLAQRRSEAEQAKRKEVLVEVREAILDRGPKVLFIALLMLGLWWFESLLGKRLTQLLAKTGRGSADERQKRAETLAGVLDNALSVVTVVGGGLMILDVVGIPIVPLMGGAAVVGLAAAFGAQNLLRDYFYGFIILLENQYKLNDAVTIAGMTGTVERITLRLTVLRDFEGRVFYIPNGQVSLVTNSTHGWSRAVFDINLPYECNVDEVLLLLTEVASELRHDPAFREVILDAPEMHGVEALGESAVTVKFSLKTMPDKKTAVRRELLRRIKQRFDERGVAFPYPQRTIQIRHAEARSHAVTDVEKRVA